MACFEDAILQMFRSNVRLCERITDRYPANDAQLVGVMMPP